MIGKGAENISKIYLGSNAVSKIYLGNELVFGGQPSIPNYLRFVALEASTIGMTSGMDTFPTLEYSLDDAATWNTFDGTAVSLASGQTMYMRGTNTTLAASLSKLSTFVATGSIEAHGNIMSLLFGSSFNGKLTIPNYCFNRLFYQCTSLVTPPELPATTLGNYCYREMFRGCSNLSSTPTLPATTMKSNCYNSMFRECTNLTTPPALPATTLATSCYGSIFYGCTNLTTTPTLPATTLAQSCYVSMFCYTGITSTPELPVKTLAEQCYGGMFAHCESLTSVELPATTLLQNCYRQLLDGCTRLNYIKALFTTTPSATYTKYWARNLADTGIFVKHIDATWDVSGDNGVPSGWTIIYYNPTTDKYYLSDKTTECDDHGNVV